MTQKLIEEGIHLLYEELGPEKTIKFFQLVGVPKGDTLKEIEEITEKMSKEEALNFVKSRQ